MQPRNRFMASLATLAAFLGMSALHAGDITIISDKLEIKGDLRLRYQTTEESEKSNRDRQRIRLRVGMNYTVNPMLSVNTRVATGTGEQTSTNQTFDGAAKQKALFLDQAFLLLKPLPGDLQEALRVYGGRMQNPLWQSYSSDIVWDTDLNPEGLGESVKLSLFGAGRVFVNALQWVINEKSAVADSKSLDGNRPQYVFSTQGGVILPAPMDSRFTLAGAIHDWVNETDRPFNDSVTGTTNSGIATDKSTATLTNDFRVLEIGGEFKTAIPKTNIPLSLQGTWIKNTAHKSNHFATGDTMRDTGYQVGAILGNAADPNTWELAFFNKRVEQDDTVSDAADSDFPGTNRQGNIYWLAFAPWKNQQFKAKFFNTSILEGAEKDIDTFQLDWQVKF